jgi:predicted nucleic acid-binding protein
MTRVVNPLPWTWLHQLEFRNALRLRIFRAEITATQRDASLNAWLSDLGAGVYAHADPNGADVNLEAERLSAQFSERLGARSLDVLHVAAALVLGCDTLLTFDLRQQALARAAGLRAPKLR